MEPLSASANTSFAGKASKAKLTGPFIPGVNDVYSQLTALRVASICGFSGRGVAGAYLVSHDGHVCGTVVGNDGSSVDLYDELRECIHHLDESSESPSGSSGSSGYMLHNFCKVLLYIDTEHADDVWCTIIND